jgi:hypothetical protein
MDITIDPLINPTFTPIVSLCMNSTAPLLPTSSTNLPAITGTWNPAIISTSTVGTTTYTFTPDNGQCARIATIDITITPLITPTFVQINPPCLNSVAPLLPTVSTNSPAIPGTWSPAIISTTTAGTSTYTFTPDNGQCANITTIDITIDPPVAPTFAPIAPLCLNSTAPILPTSSTNLPAIHGTWNPAIISTTNAGTFTYTFTPDNGLCASVATMDITIDPLINPTFAPIGPLCLNSAAPVLPTSSTNLPAIHGTWNPAIISTATPGATTYTFTPDNGQCASIATLVITVAPLVNPTFAPIGPFCINSAAPILPTGSTNLPAITGTWNPAIISTATSGTTTYTFTPDNGICASIAKMDVTITPLITPTFAPIGPLCMNSIAPVLPASSTNLPAITGTWNPAIISTATAGKTTYTFTPDNGQCASNVTMDITIDSPITPTFAPIGPLCMNSAAPVLPASSTNLPAIHGTWNPTIISTATPGTATYTFTPDNGLCASIATLDITINPLITPTFDPIGPLCKNSIAPILPASSNNLPAIPGTWNPSKISTATVGTSTYTFTPDNGQCANNTTIDITITPLVTPTFAPIGLLCQNSVAPLLPTSSNNLPAIPGTWNPAIISTTTAGKATYTFTPENGQCASIATIDITVAPLINPTFAPIGPLCINSIAPKLPASSTNLPAIPGTWNPAIISTATAGKATYTFTPDNGQCANIATIDITVVPLTKPTFAPIGPLCLNSAAPVLPTNSTNIPAIPGTWNPSKISTTTPGISIYTFTPDASQCADLFQISIEVFNELTAKVNPKDESVLGANDGSISISAPSGGSGKYKYSLDGIKWQTEPIFDKLKSGSYDVWIKDDIDCNKFLQKVEILSGKLMMRP